MGLKALLPIFMKITGTAPSNSTAGIPEGRNAERGSAAEHKEILERFEALYVNYMTQIFQDDRLDIRQTLDACRDILGIARNPEEILREMGEERIKEILSRNYEALPCSFYRAGDYRIWNRRKIN